jgi:hypothetical protein
MEISKIEREELGKFIRALTTDGHGWTRMDTDGHGWTRIGGAGNRKSETRNPKQIQKDGNFQNRQGTTGEG